MDPDRPSWKDYFYGIAEAVSQRATCLRAQCGAVVVGRDNRILGTGYNGAPPDRRHCFQDGCLMVDGHCQRTIHAEVNAVVHARQNVRGARVYVYKQNGDSEGCRSCRECLKVLASAGIAWVGVRSDEGEEWAIYP